MSDQEENNVVDILGNNPRMAETAARIKERTGADVLMVDGSNLEMLPKRFEVALNSLEGPNSMDRNRPYDGQAHTDLGIRGATEVRGVTMRDIRDAFIRAYILSSDITENNQRYKDEARKGVDAKLSGNALYHLEGTHDPIAVAQNLMCEIEMIMGIFPNVPFIAETDK